MRRRGSARARCAARPATDVRLTTTAGGPATLHSLHARPTRSLGARGAAIRVTRADVDHRAVRRVAARVVVFLTSTQRPRCRAAREKVIVEPPATRRSRRDRPGARPRAERAPRDRDHGARQAAARRRAARHGPGPARTPLLLMNGLGVAAGGAGTARRPAPARPRGDPVRRAGRRRLARAGAALPLRDARLARRSAGAHASATTASTCWGSPGAAGWRSSSR